MKIYIVGVDDYGTTINGVFLSKKKAVAALKKFSKNNRGAQLWAVENGAYTEDSFGLVDYTKGIEGEVL